MLNMKYLKAAFLLVVAMIYVTGVSAQAQELSEEQYEDPETVGESDAGDGESNGILNGITVIAEQMVPYVEAAVAPTNVTREGYKFVGWNTTFSKITENLTVKALFEEFNINPYN